MKKGGVVFIGQGPLEEIMDSDEFKIFSKQAEEYTTQILNEATMELEPDEEAEFWEWWAGKRGSSEKKAVTNAILWTIGQGLG